MAAKRAARERTASRVRKSVRAEVGKALAVIERRRSVSDESLHDARKALKRARAGLRLLRDALGHGEYAARNAALRDAARPLARVRDAKILLETVDGLLDGEARPRRRAALLQLRHDVSHERVVLRRDLFGDSDLLAHVARSLRASRPPAAQAVASRTEADAARSGLERIYRRGRKALAAAASDPSDQKLHETRKQAKYLAEALDLLGLGTSHRERKLLKRARAIAERLGDDHDLALLEGRFEALPPDAYDAQVKLAARIEHLRAKLQRKALKRARRLYERKPATFARRLYP